MIIDYHAHTWRYADGQQVDLGTECSVEWLLGTMDRAGVDRAVIVPLVYVPTSTTKRVLKDNDYILQAVKSHPDRFSGLVAVNPKDGDAVNSLKSYLDGGLSGLKLLPTAGSFFMSDHLLLDPLFSVCQEYGVPVSIRANDDIGSSPLQIEEMSRSFPVIPAFVINHMGRKWMMSEAIMVAGRTDNVYLETSDTIVEEVYAVVKGCGPRKILYATNSQFFMDEMPEHIRRHQRVMPDPAELDLVLHKNASRILAARRK